MNFATIKYYDIANGPGVRTSVFVSGCRHHCPGCFNAVAWDFHFGQPFTWETERSIIESCQLIFRLGNCDVDDILANTFGALLGLVLYKIVHHSSRK